MRPIYQRKKQFDVRSAEAAVKAGGMIRLREATAGAVLSVKAAAGDLGALAEAFKRLGLDRASARVAAAGRDHPASAVTSTSSGLREAQVQAIQESRHTSAAWRERGRRPWEVHA